MSDLTFPSTVPAEFREAATALHEAQQDSASADAVVALVELVSSLTERVAALEADQTAEDRSDDAAARATLFGDKS